jgi:SpoVK/Ycf46/Vps4 family AAA+-type ATPase
MKVERRVRWRRRCYLKVRLDFFNLFSKGANFFLNSAMQTLRVYRPRVIIHGPVGMGQGYIGAAALHHLEGYHVQSLELGSLLSDSTRVRLSLLCFALKSS